MVILQSTRTFKISPVDSTLEANWMQRRLPFSASAAGRDLNFQIDSFQGQGLEMVRAAVLAKCPTRWLLLTCGCLRVGQD